VITLEAVLVTGAAAVVAFWPQLSGIVKLIPIPSLPKPTPKPAVTYQAAMLALATVRSRLTAAGGPSKESNDAIVAITQELVAGSDK